MALKPPLEFEPEAEKPTPKPPILKSVVETTDYTDPLSYHNPISEELARFGTLFSKPESKSKRFHSSDPAITNPEGISAMQDLRSHYISAGQARHARNTAPVSKLTARRERLFRRFTLFQKIFVSNLVIILGGAVVGSWIVAQLAQAGNFNGVTFSVIIILAVLVSGAVSFSILKKAFRPFGELQKVLSNIHTGNPRARAALHRITDPDVRHFTTALNQMLNRLEENAHVIQEDQRQLQLMTAQVINAQENERKRISRELHDEASQSLTAMIMGLESACQSAPAQDCALQKQLTGLKALAVTTLEELRKLALDLRPTMLDDLGLIPAVRWLSRGAAERGNLEVQFNAQGFGENERLAPELETCLFRISQESLTNIVKHAQARLVKITLENIAPDTAAPFGKVRLTVQDDGVGFDREVARAKAYRGGHLGLFDIEERAALLGGKVEINSHLAAAPGTCITVIVPLNAAHPEPPNGLNTAAAPYVK